MKARNIDWLLLAPAAALVVMGIFMIHSAASGSDDWKDQALYALSWMLAAAVILYLPERLAYGLAYPAYGFSLLLLAAVLVWGSGGTCPLARHRSMELAAERTGQGDHGARHRPLPGGR